MNTENIQVMNQILKGEHMAIQIYDTYINSLAPGALREELISLQQDHKRHASELSAYVQHHGASPVESTGVAGTMAQTMAKINTLISSDPQDMLKELYDGEDKGLARSVQLSENKLGEEEQKLLEGIFSDEHDHLKTLKGLLAKYS